MPRLAAPLALRRDATNGLTAVLMSRPDDCFAVSMPSGEDSHRSIYLSLFGRDLKEGEEASAGARLVIGKDISDDRALELYREYLKKDRKRGQPPNLTGLGCFDSRILPQGAIAISVRNQNCDQLRPSFRSTFSPQNSP